MKKNRTGQSIHLHIGSKLVPFKYIDDAYESIQSLYRVMGDIKKESSHESMISQLYLRVRIAYTILKNMSNYRMGDKDSERNLKAVNDAKHQIDTTSNSLSQHKPTDSIIEAIITECDKAEIALRNLVRYVHSQ